MKRKIAVIMLSIAVGSSMLPGSVYAEEAQVMENAEPSEENELEDSFQEDAVNQDEEQTADSETKSEVKVDSEEESSETQDSDSQEIEDIKSDDETDEEETVVDETEEELPLVTVEEYDDALDYAQAKSSLASEYPCNYDETLTINCDTGLVTDENGQETEEYDSTVEAVVESELPVDEAADVLDASDYEVQEQSASTVTVEDAYQTQRIMVRGNFDGHTNADRVIAYGDEYILQYANESDAIAEYELLCNDENLSEVYLDDVISLEELAQEVTESENEALAPQTLSDDISTTGNSYLSWGVSYMGLDTLQARWSSAASNQVVVAVIDSGVDYTHSYLSGRMLSGYDFYNNDSDPMDDYGHGTHVAGIIADGSTDNVKILPVKVFNSSGASSSMLLSSGIQYALSEGADVINMSLGAYDTKHSLHFLDTYLQQAINQNCVCVAAAGNKTDTTGDDSADFYPGCSDLVITVGAIDNSGNLWTYSARGEEVDYVAPGVQVYSTYLNQTARYMSGTSMACPHVTATVAMLKSVKPSISVSETRSVLNACCVKVSASGTGNGIPILKCLDYTAGAFSGHNFNQTTSKAATCTAQGYVAQTCDKCQTVQKTYTAALGHSYTSSVTREATATSTGIKTYVCTRCGASYTETIPKIDGTKYFVTRLYEVCLDREPDTAGLNDWCNRINSGQTTGIEAAYGFIFSQEFQNKNYCNSCFVTKLYAAFLDRKPDTAGLNNWVSQLSSGAKREEIFNGFANSTEFYNLCRTYGITQGSGIQIPSTGTYAVGNCQGCGAKDDVTEFVRRLYTIVLDRQPDTAGLRDWTLRLKTGEQTGTQVAYGFVFSPEFTKKNYNNSTYVEYLYNAIMGRGSDAPGKANWVSQLNNGSSRLDVFYGFTNSQEFAQICNKYGIKK